MILNIKDFSIGVHKPQRDIVKNVNIEIDDGEIFVLIGESGSGKSMMIKALMGVINRKTMDISGSMVFNNSVNLIDLDEKNRRKYAGDIALIMQNPMATFNPSMKIGKQMILDFSKTISKDEMLQRAKNSLRAVKLDNVDFILNSYAHELSGGMLQRVMIAISLMSNAKLIVADEPTTALDVINQEYVLDEFLELKKQGKSIFLVTHDFYVARKIADKVAVISKGEILETGTLKEIFENPKCDYTKTLIRASDYTKSKN